MIVSNRGTDTRPPFFQIEESVIDDYDLHPIAGWLYVVIVRHINRKKNDAFPSITRLAKIAKMSKASVLRYTKVLEEKGLIEVIREKDDTGEKQVNHYRLLTATRVVSDSNYGSSSQQQPVVSDSNINQKKINQTNLTIEEKEIPAPIVAVALEPVETDTVKESPPALPESTGKVLAFTPATETDEDTPRRERKPNKNAPIHDALIAAFNLTGIKMNPKADKMYWAVAAELSDFPVDRVAELYSYVRRKSQAERWNTFTVNALAKYAPDFLRDHPHKITYIVDDSALPKAAGAEGDAIPITADKRAEAERMMADLVAKMNGNGVKRASNRQ